LCRAEGSYLCQRCEQKLPLKKNLTCVFCHRVLSAGAICNCRKETALRAVFVVADYHEQIIQDLLHNFKYNYLLDLEIVLGKLASRFLKEQDCLGRFDLNQDNTILVPVPLHKKRLLQRGFNQSEFLARQIAGQTGFKTANLLVRIINTPSQVNFNRLERQANVHKAFALNTQLPVDLRQNVLLIDDVVTTGSTLLECALVLKQSGYINIYALVIAQNNV